MEGGCHCGALRYTVPDVSGFAFLCHCDSCRRLASGARLAGVSVPQDTLEVTGEMVRYTYAGGKAPIHLHFCGLCSTQIYAEPTAYPGIAALRIGTLDDDSVIQSVKRVYAHQACAWEPEA